MKKIIFAECCVLFVGAMFLNSGCASLNSPSSNFKASVSFTEFNGKVCDLFQSLDANHDGLLELDEYAKRPSWIGNVKTMPSGQVSIVDFLIAADTRFQQFAHTQASTLTATEFEQLERSRP